MNALILTLFLACGDTAPPAQTETEPTTEPAPKNTDAHRGKAGPGAERGPMKSSGGVMTLDNPTGASNASPAELYAQCKERVELPETQAECTSASDCTKAGCSSEVCTSVAGAKDLNTMCEVQPCFAVLETCGCVDGRCTWSIKSE